METKVEGINWHAQIGWVVSDATAGDRIAVPSEYAAQLGHRLARRRHGRNHGLLFTAQGAVVEYTYDVECIRCGEGLCFKPLDPQYNEQILARRMCRYCPELATETILAHGSRGDWTQVTRIVRAARAGRGHDDLGFPATVPVGVPLPGLYVEEGSARSIDVRHRPVTVAEVAEMMSDRHRKTIDMLPIYRGGDPLPFAFDLVKRDSWRVPNDAALVAAIAEAAAWEREHISENQA